MLNPILREEGTSPSFTVCKVGGKKGDSAFSISEKLCENLRFESEAGDNNDAPKAQSILPRREKEEKEEKEK